MCITHLFAFPPPCPLPQRCPRMANALAMHSSATKTTHTRHGTRPYLAVLRDLDLFDDLTDRGTIPGAVLAGDPDLLRAFPHCEVECVCLDGDGERRRRMEDVRWMGGTEEGRGGGKRTLAGSAGARTDGYVLVLRGRGRRRLQRVVGRGSRARPREGRGQHREHIFASTSRYQIGE